MAHKDHKDNEHPIVSQLGQKIRKLRKEHKWSLDTLAEESGIHFTYASRLELGRQAPTLGILARIADAFKISVSELLAFHPENQDPNLSEIHDLLKKLSKKEVVMSKEMLKTFIKNRNKN